MIYALLGISSDAKDHDSLRASYGKTVKEFIVDVSHFLYLNNLDPELTRQLGTMQKLLLQLELFNNIAFERFLESFDEITMEILVTFPQRGDIDIPNMLKAAVKVLAENAKIEWKDNTSRNLVPLVAQNGLEDEMRQMCLKNDINTKITNQES
ncbi:Fc.00g097720.m01.CDS01 [Cosmosporella sp. VM-42]